MILQIITYIILKLIYKNNNKGMKNPIKLSISILAILFTLNATAQSSEKLIEKVKLMDTITSINNKLNIDMLETGMHKYLVYMEKSDGSLANISLWERYVMVKDDRIIISQQWKNENELKTRHVYSISDINLQPIYHYSKWGESIDAFDFNENEVIGSDSIINNRKKDFIQIYNIKPLNWELDLEVLQTLNYELNKTFVLNFYHPGSGLPSKFYNYEVVGIEDIKLPGNIKKSCWKVKIDYDIDDKAYFYVDTETNSVLKVVQYYKDFKRYKMKLEI